MKKLIAGSLVAATMLTTAATADMKVGLGFDVLGSAANMLRVSIDGLATGLRVEPRLNYANTNNGLATATTTSRLSWGIGAAYKVLGDVAVAASFDSKGYTSTQVGTATATDTGTADTDIRVGLETEQSLTKQLTMSFGLGYSLTTSKAAGATTTSSRTDPYAAVTMRLWF